VSVNDMVVEQSADSDTLWKEEITESRLLRER
jgi:hypothetical protein